MNKMNTAKYPTYKGFHDLREFKLPKKVFMKLWKAQEELAHVGKHIEYFMTMERAAWRKALELAAEYQRVLARYERKTNESNNKTR